MKGQIIDFMTLLETLPSKLKSKFSTNTGHVHPSPVCVEGFLILDFVDPRHSTNFYRLLAVPIGLVSLFEFHEYSN